MISSLSSGEMRLFPRFAQLLVIGLRDYNGGIDLWRRTHQAPLENQI
jgi:hypothetical protein